MSRQNQELHNLIENREIILSQREDELTLEVDRNSEFSTVKRRNVYEDVRTLAEDFLAGMQRMYIEKPVASDMVFFCEAAHTDSEGDIVMRFACKDWEELQDICIHKRLHNFRLLQQTSKFSVKALSTF